MHSDAAWKIAGSSGTVCTPKRLATAPHMSGNTPAPVIAQDAAAPTIWVCMLMGVLRVKMSKIVGTCGCCGSISFFQLICDIPLTPATRPTKAAIADTAMRFFNRQINR
jgi:hypothetical protein